MSRSIKILKTTDETLAWRSSLSQEQRVGFVPTMGALHEGHGALLKRIRSRCDVSVLSIFVNPTQFGANEDLAKYPRTFEHDLALAQELGVDVVFAPTPEVMYPHGYSTYVEETALTQPLCGRFRPGHFRGVTTIVLKLFNLIRPNLALFGLKDAQQFFVLHKMAHDLNLNVAVEGVPTVRESDGLAMSSRNAYLSAQERALAPALYRELQMVANVLKNGQEPARTLNESSARLNEQGFRVQYLECVELPLFNAANVISANSSYLLAIAAQLGNTRLIDNILINPERLSTFGVRLN